MRREAQDDGDLDSSNTFVSDRINWWWSHWFCYRDMVWKEQKMSQIKVKIKNIENTIKVLKGLGVWDFKDGNLLNVVSKLNGVLTDINELIKFKRVKRRLVDDERE